MVSDRISIYAAAAAAVKSLQSCLTLCDPIDGSPPGSPVPGILQARTLEWGAISFSNAWKWKVKVNLLSHVRLFATPWTAAYQAPPSMGFSRQEYWRGVPSPSPPLMLLIPKSIHLVLSFLEERKSSFQGWVCNCLRPSSLCFPTDTSKSICQKPNSLTHHCQILCNPISVNCSMTSEHCKPSLSEWSRSVVSDSLRFHGL